MSTRRQSRAPADPIDAEWLSLGDAAAAKSVHVDTLRRRIADGTLPAYRFGPRKLFVKRDDLDALYQRVPTVTRTSPRRAHAGARDATA